MSRIRFSKYCTDNAQRCTLQPKPDRSKPVVCLLPRCTDVDAAQVCLPSFPTTVHCGQHTGAEALVLTAWHLMCNDSGTVAVTLGVALNKRNAGQCDCVSEWEGSRSVERWTLASILWFQLTRIERRRHGHLKYLTKLLLSTRRCRSCQCLSLIHI